MAAPRFTQALEAGRKNIVIVVFDAFSAYNISLYGYPRKTTPNIDRLAEKAIVYHNHFAGANFTSPGTATILTGTYPWTHRAFGPNSTVADKVASRNIFNVLDGYYRMAFTHNRWANTLLEQFEEYMDDLIPSIDLFIKSSPDALIQGVFRRDDDIATVSWARTISLEQGYAYSLFLSRVLDKLREARLKDLIIKFPLGLPAEGNDSFILEEAIDGIHDRLIEAVKPLFGYFHFLPPHFPYRTHIDFYDRFKNDGFKPTEKANSVFARHVNDLDLAGDRKNYDEYILYVDREFGNFYDQLERSGLLENTYLILMSDHGEMFERGITGHSTPSLNQPLIRVPLMIFEPGRTERLDIYSLTNAVDILPTVLNMAGQSNPPEWAEGVLLPPFNTKPDPNGSIYSMYSYNNEGDQALTQASVSLIQGNYKLVYYFGYNQISSTDIVELFDIQADPEEMRDLSKVESERADQMLSELKAKLVEANQPYT